MTKPLSNRAKLRLFLAQGLLSPSKRPTPMDSLNYDAILKRLDDLNEAKKTHLKDLVDWLEDYCNTEASI